MKKSALLLTLLLALSACGQKGKLYLPESEEDQQTESQSSDG